MCRISQGNLSQLGALFYKKIEKILQTLFAYWHPHKIFKEFNILHHIWRKAGFLAFFKITNQDNSLQVYHPFL